MPEEKKEAPRYIVSIGEYKSEKLALERRKASLDAGLTCKVIDAEESDMEKLYAAILLLAEQVKRLGENVSNALEVQNDIFRSQTDSSTRIQIANDGLEEKIAMLVCEDERKRREDVVLGSKIKSRYTEKGFKGNQLADILGVKPGTFSKWICGRAKIPQDKLEKLCAILQVKESDLKGE